MTKKPAYAWNESMVCSFNACVECQNETELIFSAGKVGLLLPEALVYPVMKLLFVVELSLATSALLCPVSWSVRLAPESVSMIYVERGTLLSGWAFCAEFVAASAVDVVISGELRPFPPKGMVYSFHNQSVHSYWKWAGDQCDASQVRTILHTCQSVACYKR